MSFRAERGILACVQLQRLDERTDKRAVRTARVFVEGKWRLRRRFRRAVQRLRADTARRRGIAQELAAGRFSPANWWVSPPQPEWLASHRFRRGLRWRA